MLLRARSLVVDRPGDGAAMLRVLDGVDLDVPAGGLVDVVGPSGAGKTTLLLALARLLPGATGTLTLDGEDAAAVAPQQWRARVALVPQRAALVAGSVADNLRLPWTLKVRSHEGSPGDERLRASLAAVGLAEVELSRDVARLSAGQAARVALLRVLLTNPQVLLLDEPDANLDDESAARVSESVDAFVGSGGGAVRVRHVRTDERANVRYDLRGGNLTEVSRRG